MKLTRIRIHNFRSIIDANVEAHDFTMLVGANNAGKSNFMNALRCFYGDLSWTDDDFPKPQLKPQDEESWVELSFDLSDAEWDALDDKYKDGVSSKSLVLKRYFKGDKAKDKQNNIYAVVNDKVQDKVFYGTKSMKAARCGRMVYIPAFTSPDDQMKTTGPSPLRDMLNFMLSRIIPNSGAYASLRRAFEEFNREANNENGFLSTIAQPINDALKPWGIKLDLSVNSITPTVITKSLISYSFTDSLLGNTGFGLDRYGHGFQRAVIYELFRLASSFQQETQTRTDEFEPNYTLLLFEEPEAFLHPAQQENMAYYLREFGNQPDQQVIVTSHSPVFVSKNTDDFGQICRLQKCGGVSRFYQLNQDAEENLIKSGGDFLAVLKRYIEDPNVIQSNKEKAKKFVKCTPTEEIANQYEEFRYQLWLDADRASMFFADKVLLVEGATEKMLFNYLLANEWHDLAKERIFVVDALGKYNFHRFISLFAAYGIHHGIMMDNDNNQNEHAVINQLIRDRQNEFRLAEPFEFTKDLETYLGISLPDRNDQKPLQIIPKLKDGSITPEMLVLLKDAFCKVLNIQTNRNQ